MKYLVFITKNFKRSLHLVCAYLDDEKALKDVDNNAL